MNYKLLRMIWMKLGAFLNKQQKNQLADVKKFKSFLEHNYMKSSSDFVINYISHYVYDIPHVIILTIKWYNLSSYEYVNIKYQKIELRWSSIFPAWVEFKLAIKKQAILIQFSSAVQMTQEWLFYIRKTWINRYNDEKLNLLNKQLYFKLY